jgi:hypothetical protein
MARKTPQQKKRESYAKDRRNTYGERGAASRFAIAQRKRDRARRERAAARALEAVAARDAERGERAEAKVAAKRRGAWTKVADEPLGTVLGRKLERRERVGSLPRRPPRRRHRESAV